MVASRNPPAQGLSIVADANLAALDETFALHGEVTRLEGRGISRDDLEQADVLLVRSVTQVGPELLESTPVRFVGTATIGIDHLDTAWLNAAGIAWSSAPGCNADAAAQYTLAMMMLACRRLQRDFFAQKVGIIGRGNVGSRLQTLLDALGIESVACDPPLARQGVAGLVSQAEALDNDIVCLHVPLTREGPYATRRMIAGAQLAALPDGAVLVNTARGGVVHGRALQDWLSAGRGHAALDVWPDEPAVDPALLENVTVATPHVAGYSAEGKLRGTTAIYAAFCRHFAITPQPLPVLPEALMGGFGEGEECHSLATRAVLAVSGVERDDAQMRRRAGPPGFLDALRRDYPRRREFQSTRLDDSPVECAPLLNGLGFRTPGQR